MLRRGVARAVAFGLVLLIGTSGAFVFSLPGNPDRSVRLLMFALQGGNIATVEFPSWRVNYAGEQFANAVYPVGIRGFSKPNRAIALYFTDDELHLFLFDLEDGKTLNLGDCAGLAPKANLLQAYIATSGELVVVGSFSEQYSFWDQNSGSVSSEKINERRFGASLDLAKVERAEEGRWQKQQKTEHGIDRQRFPNGLPSFDRLRQEIAREKIDGNPDVAFWKIVRASLEAHRRELADTLASKGLLDAAGTPHSEDTILYWDNSFVVLRHDGRMLLVAHGDRGFQVLGKSPVDFGKEDLRLLSPGAVDIMVE